MSKLSTKKNYLTGYREKTQPVLKHKTTTKPTEWYVYIIRCSDTSLYTGITTNVERRFSEHAGNSAGNKGAKYFRARSPEKIMYVEGKHTRSTASQREIAVKKLSRQAKLALIQANKK